MATPDLAEVENLAATLVARHLGDGWRFRWDRAVRRAGSCRHDRGEITLSHKIFSIEANRVEARDVILHEIAHGLAGHAAGHGPVWREIAASIGARPQRCHHLELPPLPYVGTCDCGPRHGRARVPAPTCIYHCRTCRREIAWAGRS